MELRGLNRHQSYAYQGYAMPDSIQQLDAQLLKKQLGCNAVRTSHYPCLLYTSHTGQRGLIGVFQTVHALTIRIAEAQHGGGKAAVWVIDVYKRQGSGRQHSPA